MQREQNKQDNRGNPQNLVPEFAELAHALAGIKLPQDKKGLLDHVEGKETGKEVVALLQDLPDREYATMADIMAAARGTPEIEEEI
jgi:hypothetical protein